MSRVKRRDLTDCPTGCYAISPLSSHLARPVCVGARGIRAKNGAITVEVEGGERHSSAESPAASSRRIRPATDLHHSYTCTSRLSGRGFCNAWEIVWTTGSSGALRQRSTTHALADMLHHWHAAVDNGESVRTCTVFVDFAKAFDRVDHNVLSFVANMVSLGLPDVTVRCICAFLRRRQRVKIGDVLSDWLQLSAGMPQGSYQLAH